MVWLPVNSLRLFAGNYTREGGRRRERREGINREWRRMDAKKLRLWIEFVFMLMRVSKRAIIFRRRLSDRGRILILSRL
jgi:hypothetical protein